MTVMIVGAAVRRDRAMLLAHDAIELGPRALFAGVTARPHEEICEREWHVEYLGAVDRGEALRTLGPHAIRQIEIRNRHVRNVRRHRERMVDADERAGRV